MLSESERGKIRERGELLSALESVEQIADDNKEPSVDDYHDLVGRAQTLASVAGPARQLVRNILDDALAKAIGYCLNDLKDAIQPYGCPLDRLISIRKSTSEYSLYRAPEPPPAEQHDTDVSELKPVESDDEAPL